MYLSFNETLNDLVLKFEDKNIFFTSRKKLD